MAKLLYIGTHGTDSPTDATFPFLLAKGAIDAGHQPSIILMGEAAPLIKDHIAQQIQGVGITPLKELMEFLVSQEVPITVRGLCARARGVTDEDLAGKNAKFGTPVDAANAVAEHDKVVTL